MGWVGIGRLPGAVTTTPESLLELEVFDPGEAGSVFRRGPPAGLFAWLLGGHAPNWWSCALGRRVVGERGGHGIGQRRLLGEYTRHSNNARTERRRHLVPKNQFDAADREMNLEIGKLPEGEACGLKPLEVNTRAREAPTGSTATLNLPLLEAAHPQICSGATVDSVGCASEPSPCMISIRVDLHRVAGVVWIPVIDDPTMVRSAR